MPYIVYVLYSEIFNKHYVGFTSDLENRIKSHNELTTKGYTVKYRPWKLIYTEEYLEKKEAIAREKFLKSGQGRAFIKTLPH